LSEGGYSYRRDRMFPRRERSSSHSPHGVGVEYGKMRGGQGGILAYIKCWRGKRERLALGF